MRRAKRPRLTTSKKIPVIRSIVRKLSIVFSLS